MSEELQTREQMLAGLTAPHDLAARIERADGPDRALDAEIHALLNPGDRWVIGHEPGRFPQTPIYGSLMDAVNSFTDKREAGDFINAPRYTASIDAAMQLVPVWLTPTIVGHDREVRLLNGIGLPVGGKDYRSTGSTVAQALCAAALRAQVQP